MKQDDVIGPKPKIAQTVCHHQVSRDPKAQGVAKNSTEFARHFYVLHFVLFIQTPLIYTLVARKLYIL